MLTFSPRTPSRFLYRADFSRDSYANISFFDADRETVLFHLSLRAKEGLAVCNRRGAAPGSWHKERPRRVQLGQSARVEIRFDAPRLSVRLDGQEIFAFGGAFRRTPFPDLPRIAHVDFQGGLAPASIDMDVTHPGARPDRLHMDARLTLRARCPAGSTRDALRLHLDDCALTLPLLPGPTAKEVRAILPGRIWSNRASDTPLSLRLMAGTRELDQLTITPADLVDRIGPLVTECDLSGDPGLAALVIEHVHFSGIAPQLPAAARAGLARLSGVLGLDGAFATPDGAPPIAPDTAPAPDPAQLRAAAAEQTLTEALLAAAPALRALQPGQDAAPVLAALSPPPGRARLYFYIALTEPLCLQGGMAALDAHARTQGLDQVEMLTPTPGDAWFNSGLLPYLLLRGEIQTLRNTMRQLEDLRAGWIMTPPLAWTAAQVLQSDRVHEKLREEILYSFLHFLRKRSTDYWERTNCVALIDTALDMVEAAPSLPNYMQRDICKILCRVYGLSRPFWDRVAARGLEGLPPLLDAARQAFAHLDTTGTASSATEMAQDTALQFFDRAECAEVTRVRRDLRGPSGVGPTPEVSSLTRAGMDPGEAALRHMAAPGTTDPEADLEEGLRHAACKALPRCYSDIPAAPYCDLQDQACRTAQDLLCQAQAGADPVTDLAPLLPQLMTLSGTRSHHLGLGLGLSLLGALRNAGAEQAAARLEQALAGMIRTLTTTDTAPPLSDAERARGEPQKTDPIPTLTDLACAPALAQPLRRLSVTPDSPLADLVAQAARAHPTPPLPDLTADLGLAPANPLFDTIVTVFSCRPNLNTRIPQLRAAWLDRLSELGVPYVIVTGDGDGTLDGDLLSLDAPDDYEGLPQKTLATIAWVQTQTPYAHMLKIDDDCFLNADTFFHTLSYRKFDYYGRTLTRQVGQMDRAWHMGKSRSERGRLELDKSPEPARYCDGGSGYVLSRTAMQAALEAAASPEGRTLIQVSFMEDKLLGDLLSLRGIQPENEDYRITVRRRPAANKRTVSRWENGFYPSRTNPVALVHLDDEHAQISAQQTLNKAELTPKKLWPSYQPARLGADSNALEMITGAERLGPARDAPVAVVACMRNEMFMLPAFLAHYRRLGVSSFLIADNCSDDGTLEYLADQPDVALFSVDTAYKHSRYGVAWQQALMSNLRPNRWSLVADADELLVWQRDQQTTLPDLLQEPGFDHADAARIFMLDLYPKGPLAQASFASGDPFAEAGFTDKTPFLETSYGRGPYSDSPTWTSAVRHRLIPGSRAELFVAQKVALLKYSPFMRLSAGLHYVSGCRLAQRELLFGHFKYNADFRRKAQAEVARRQHFNDAEEYRKYLALVSEGRDVIFDPETSVPWQDCDFVKRRLD